MWSVLVSVVIWQTRDLIYLVAIFSRTQHLFKWITGKLLLNPFTTSFSLFQLQQGHDFQVSFCEFI